MIVVRRDLLAAKGVVVDVVHLTNDVVMVRLRRMF